MLVTYFVDTTTVAERNPPSLVWCQLHSFALECRFDQEASSDSQSVSLNLQNFCRQNFFTSAFAISSSLSKDLYDEEIPTNSNWLTRAAVYAAIKADDTLRLLVSAPVAVRGIESDTIGARIILHGCDIAGEKLQQWQIDEIIHPGATIKIELPPLPFQDRID